jgi:uncharacterized protein (DUF4415 family)
MNTSETDWDKLRTMTDDEIDTSDIPQLDDEFYSKAELRVPEGKVPLLLAIDEETAEWFQRQAGDLHKNISDALRDYAESHR